jgi:hypothetical protein
VALAQSHIHSIAQGEGMSIFYTVKRYEFDKGFRRKFRGNDMSTSDPHDMALHAANLFNDGLIDPEDLPNVFWIELDRDGNPLGTFKIESWMEPQFSAQKVIDEIYIG